MNTGYTYPTPEALPSKSERETPTVQYPTLCIKITKDNLDAVKAFGESGEATITFNRKSLRIGKEYDSQSGEGEITLEVTEITPKPSSDLEEITEEVINQMADLALGQAA